jgi:hypothetical protein
MAHPIENQDWLRRAHLDQFHEETHNLLDWLYKLRNSIVNAEPTRIVESNAVGTAREAVKYEAHAQICFDQDPVMRSIAANVLQITVNTSERLQGSINPNDALPTVLGLIDDVRTLSFNNE